MLSDPNAEAVDRLQRARSAAIAREYVCLAGVDRGRCMIWSGRANIYYFAHIIDIGRRPHVSRPAPPEADPAPVVEEPQVLPPGDTMRRVLTWMAENGNEPATSQQIAEGLGLSAVRLRYVLQKQSARYLRKVGSVANAAGGPPSYLYVAIDPEAHLAIESEGTAERVMAWFADRDNQPAAADEVAADMDLSADTLRQMMNHDKRFCKAGKAVGPNGGRARNLYQVVINGG